MRSVRTIDRQYQAAEDPDVRGSRDGDMRRIPDVWDDNRIAAVREQAGLEGAGSSSGRSGGPSRWTTSS